MNGSSNMYVIEPVIVHIKIQLVITHHTVFWEFNELSVCIVKINKT